MLLGLHQTRVVSTPLDVSHEHILAQTGLHTMLKRVQDVLWTTGGAIFLNSLPEMGNQPDG